MTPRYWDRLEVTVAYNELDRLQLRAEQGERFLAHVSVMANNALIVANGGPTKPWRPKHMQAAKSKLLNILSGNPEVPGDRGIMPLVYA